MNKILSTISIDDEALNPLRDYFFNNYRGEKFEIILKGEFYIEYKLCDKVQKFYVKQEESLTKISLATDNISNGIILMIHNNQFSYDNENNCYIANTSIWFKREIYNEVLCHEYEKMLTDIFSYIVVFFKYENKVIALLVAVAVIFIIIIICIIKKISGKNRADKNREKLRKRAK